jgi:hypothetical protein
MVYKGFPDDYIEAFLLWNNLTLKLVSKNYNIK